MLWRKATDIFDSVSDSITTFRTVIYMLLFYIATALVLALTGHLQFSAQSILLSVVSLVLICMVTNRAMAKLFKIPPNHDSDIITALILSLILAPAQDGRGYLILAVAGVVAVASKFVLTYHGRHVFNPAALGAVIVGFVFNNYADWWIGNSTTALILLGGGFLIVRKMRRFQMTLLFGLLYVAYLIVLQPVIYGGSTPSFHEIYIAIVSSPLLFFVPVMLTEPITSPTRRRNIIVYSIIAATFYSIGKLHTSPEQALLIANAATFILEPNRGAVIRFIKRTKEAVGIYSYSFLKPKGLVYVAGQYMEWTLPKVGIDARGNRRYMTISSSPTEEHLMFTVKGPARASKFKQRLAKLKPGQEIAATRRAGEFTLPRDTKLKLAFIAGGVGITPFRSIVKSLADKKEKRDAVLFYSVNDASEIAFADLFNKVVATKYVVTKGTDPNYLHGYIDKKLISENLPDYKDRLFYISGPQAFVAAVRLALLDMGVSQSNIKTDFFPGYN